jgi:predicted DNA-binding ribbon-helix-helix protein
VHGWTFGPKERGRPTRLRSFHASGRQLEASDAAMNPATRPPASRSQKSKIHNRTIILKGHKTGVSLEEAFWTALKEIAAIKNVRVATLAETIDSTRKNINLSSAIRLYVLDFYKHKKGATARRSTKH